jgi:hypothetical protein
LNPILFHPDAEAEVDHSIGFYEERLPGGKSIIQPDSVGQSEEYGI